MKGSGILSVFKGAATALITPFKDGKIDYVAMGRPVSYTHLDVYKRQLLYSAVAFSEPLYTVKNVALTSYFFNISSTRGVTVS